MLLGLLRDREGREERERERERDSLEFKSEVSSVCWIGWELVDPGFCNNAVPKPS